MSIVEKYYADHADEQYRDLLGRYAYGWAAKPVQKLAKNLVGLDLLSAVEVAQRLNAASERL